MKAITSITFLFLLLIFFTEFIVFAQEVEFVKLKWNFVFCSVICLILFIALGIAALVVILSGLKYIHSESSMQRDEAKKRIFYAIISLIFIFIAALLVNFLAISPIEKFDCWCTNLIAGNKTYGGNFTSPLLVEIVYPGEGSILENGTIVWFLGRVAMGGKAPYQFEWSSTPAGVDRKITKSDSWDRFEKSLQRGDYVITLKITDSEGRIGIDTVNIRIIIPKPPT